MHICLKIYLYLLLLQTKGNIIFFSDVLCLFFNHSQMRVGISKFSFLKSKPKSNKTKQTDLFVGHAKTLRPISSAVSSLKLQYHAIINPFYVNPHLKHFLTALRTCFILQQ